MSSGPVATEGSSHGSPWAGANRAARYPGLDADVVAEVVVVGAGIVGLTTALTLARDGIDVVLVEARQVGQGTTGHTTGKVTSQHGLLYSRLIERHGFERALSYARANQAAVDTVARIAEELGMGDSGAGPGPLRCPAYAYTVDESLVSEVQAEHAAALRLGLPASLDDEVGLNVAVTAGLRFDDQVMIHPGAYTSSLAAGLARSGGRIFEATRARSVKEEADHVMVETSGATVRAAKAVVATLLPFVDQGGFFAKTRPTRSYGVALHLATGGRDFGARQAMQIDVGSPARSTRPWADGSGPGLIVVGGGHPTGEGDPAQEPWAELVSWARRHLDVTGVVHHWSAQDFISADGIPYVGRSPRMLHTYVATGFAKWGLTNGTVAAEILADAIRGRTSAWSAAFDATRIGSATTVAKLAEDNLTVARHFVGDRVGRLRAPSPDNLAPGEGGVVRTGGRAVGAYRDPEGHLHAVSITCTHMGCTLRWNRPETSWDCPCHGSRFAVDGSVLDGPAVDPLEPVPAGDDVGPDDVPN